MEDEWMVSLFRIILRNRGIYTSGEFVKHKNDPEIYSVVVFFFCQILQIVGEKSQFVSVSPIEWQIGNLGLEEQFLN